MVLQANFVEEYSFAAVSSIFTGLKMCFSKKNEYEKKNKYTTI